MSTNCRYGLGTIHGSCGGLLQGDLSVTQTTEVLRLGTGTTASIDETLPTKKRATLTFSSSGVATGITLAPGLQTPANVSFRFNGSGPALSELISAVLTSAEYTFTEKGIATVRLEYEAIGAAVTVGSTTTSAVGSASSVKMGLGTISWGGTGSLLQGTVTAGASGDHLDNFVGIPGTLSERYTKAVAARMTASMAIFAGDVPVGGSAADVVFTHHSGLTVTISDAVLIRGERRFVQGGMALTNAEWLGTALTVA